MRRAWQIASHSPHLPIVGYLVYVGARGLIAFSGDGARDIAPDLPSWLLLLWGISLAGGGILAVFGCVVERTRAESSGLSLCLSGMFLYLVGDIGAMPAVILLTLMCISRLWVLHDARKNRDAVIRLINRGAA